MKRMIVSGRSDGLVFQRDRRMVHEGADEERSGCQCAEDGL